MLKKLQNKKLHPLLLWHVLSKPMFDNICAHCEIDIDQDKLQTIINELIKNNPERAEELLSALESLNQEADFPITITVFEQTFIVKDEEDIAALIKFIVDLLIDQELDKEESESIAKEIVEREIGCYMR